MWLPVERSWRLNERHYGALQGLDKAQTVAKHGEAQVKIWRPQLRHPPRRSRWMTPSSEVRHPIRRPRSQGAPGFRIAHGHARPGDAVLGIRIVPELRAGTDVLVVAHGNSLRALVKMLDGCRGATSSNSTSRPVFRCCTSSTANAALRADSWRPGAIAAQDAVRRQTEKNKRRNSQRRPPRGSRRPQGQVIGRVKIRRSAHIQVSGAIASFSPLSASVKSHLAGEPEGRSLKSDSSLSNSSSSLCASGGAPPRPHPHRRDRSRRNRALRRSPRPHNRARAGSP